MILINTTKILIIIGAILWIMGILLKKKIVKNIGIAILIFVIIFWVIFFIWAMEEESIDEHENQQENETISQNNNNEINDITKQFLNSTIYKYGIITKIEDNKIYFSDKDNNLYLIENDEKINYIDGRTGTNYSFNDIKENWYIDLNNNQKCLLYKNIKGEELKKEILINLSLPDDIDMVRASVDEIKEVQQLGNNEAIVTFGISDIVRSEYYPEINDEEYSFDIKLKLTNDTQYNTNFNGNSTYNASTIENSKHLMLYLRIKSNTVENEHPEILEFDSYSN